MLSVFMIYVDLTCVKLVRFDLQCFTLSYIDVYYVSESSVADCEAGA